MRILLVALAFLSVVSAADSSWYNIIDFPNGISDVVAVNVNDGIYIAGGCQSVSQSTTVGSCTNVTDTMWMLQANSATWTQLPSMPRRRYRYAAAAVGNLIYYVGGRVYMNASEEFSDIVVSEIDVYNTQTQKWSTLSTQNCSCTSISDAAAFVIGNKLYVTGGYAPSYDLLNSTIVLDTSISLEQQQFQANVVAQRNWAAGDLGAVTVNGIGYVMGGFSTDFCYPIATMSSYDPSTNKWTDRKPFVHRRGDFAYVSIGQYIYVIGGETKAAGCVPEKLTIAVPVADVERYDTVSGEWIDYAPIAIQRFRFTAVAVKDEILDIGGQGEAINNAFPLIPDVYALNITQYEINRTRTTPTPTTPPNKNHATMMGVSIITIVAVIAAAFL